MDQEFWKNHNYEVYITKDSSPSLRWLGSESMSDYKPETMHHHGGAFSETDHLYGNATREALDQGLRSFLVVGLGLGYIEWVIASESIQRNIRPEDIQILSFEYNPVLREEFLRYVETGVGNTIYDQMTSFYSVESGKVQEFLKKAYALKNFRLEGNLDKGTQAPQKYQCVFHDAFSSKLNPELWAEDFLEYFFKNFCVEKNCHFRTYACKGNLKRTLARAGFQVEKMPGFFGKRDSTRAYR